jgi:hypothetical protein
MEVSDEFHASVALPRRNSPGTHWTGGWVWIQSQCVRYREEKDLLVVTGIEPRLSSS